MSRTVHPMTSRVAGVLQRTQGSAVSHFGAIWTRDTFRINTLLIKYRTARAGSGAPHAQCCQVLGFPMEFGYFNTVVGGCFSFQKRVFYSPERDFYQGTPSKCDWASELVLSSNWAGFVGKTWQPCSRGQGLYAPRTDTALVIQNTQVC